MFGRKKKSTSKHKPSRDEVLKARPVRLVEEPVVPDGKGGGRLTVKLRQTKWSGRLFRMPDGATKTFELDEVGVLVWGACDGRTTVRRLVEAVAGRYGISPREAEVSTFTFLRVLTKKGLIGLAVEVAGAKVEDRK